MESGSRTAARDRSACEDRARRGGIDRPLLILLAIALFVLCLALLGAALTGAAAA